MTHPDKASFVGRSIPRREDRRLLTGQGRFIADIELPRGEKASGVASLGIGNERRIQRGESAGPMLRQQQMKIVRVNANAQSHVRSFQARRRSPAFRSEMKRPGSRPSCY